MKQYKLLSCLLVLAVAVVCFLTLPTQAQAANTDDLYFVLSNDKESYSVTGCKYSASGELVIPAIYNGKPVTQICNIAFRNCDSLTSVSIPDSVSSIGECAFQFCDNLTSVNIPYNVTEIHSAAFEECTSLTSITIPDSVTTIGDYAFFNCTSLTSITIPESVTTIGSSAFRNCTNLTGIWVDENNLNYCSDNKGILFNKDKTLLLQAPGTISGDYAVPDSTITIGANAFMNCTRLTSVIIPDSVTTIGLQAFRNCTALTAFYYTGTQEQWSAITIGSSNDSLTSATIIYNYTGTPEDITQIPGDIDGNEVVDQEDAVYLLLHTLFGEEIYPLGDVDADIDGNGAVNQEDAVYLLLHTLFGDAIYPLKKGA